MAALHDNFGQPHQLVLKIASILEAPKVKHGDTVTLPEVFTLDTITIANLPPKKPSHASLLALTSHT